MIAKPAMLECTRCGKIFIGWKTDGPSKSAPTCLKCQTRRAWEGLTSAIEPRKSRGAGGKRAPARKSATRSAARKPAGKQAGASATKRRTAKAQRSR